ncbi:hypothetical protein ACF1BP_24105 [Streptomyces sp. NPDC014735]|uniref:hypothetical protein n=1 Tax=Streptomyces TaxID=1883 RepID=UPI00100F727E|nr:hypothetical protein [Streptomyces sp. M3]
MSNPTLHATYSDASQAAGEQAAALQLLLARAAAEPDLALALAQVDTTEMKGALDTANLLVALAEAEAERDLNAGLAERHRRRAAAGAALGDPCRCAHSAATHSPRLTADGLLPCRHGHCGCRDLAFR